MRESARDQFISDTAKHRELDPERWHRIGAMWRLRNKPRRPLEPDRYTLREHNLIGNVVTHAASEFEAQAGWGWRNESVPINGVFVSAKLWAPK